MTLAAKSNIKFFTLIPNVRSNVLGMYQSAKSKVTKMLAIECRL